MSLSNRFKTLSQTAPKKSDGTIVFTNKQGGGRGQGNRGVVVKSGAPKPMGGKQMNNRVGGKPGAGRGQQGRGGQQGGNKGGIRGGPQGRGGRGPQGRGGGRGGGGRGGRGGRGGKPEKEVSKDDLDKDMSNYWKKSGKPDPELHNLNDQMDEYMKAKSKTTTTA